MPKPFNMILEAQKDRMLQNSEPPASLARPPERDPWADAPTVTEDDVWGHAPTVTEDDVFGPQTSLTPMTTPQQQQSLSYALNSVPPPANDADAQRRVQLLTQLQNRAAERARDYVSGSSFLNSPTGRATRSTLEALGIDPQTADNQLSNTSVAIPEFVRGWYRDTSGHPNIPFTPLRVPGPATLLGAPEELPKTLKLGPAMVGAADTATLGNFDELTGAAQTLVNDPLSARNPASFYRQYAPNRNNVREFQQRVQSQAPASYAVGNAAGNVGLAAATGGAGGELTAGMGIAPRLLTNTAIGGTLGAISGSGNSQAGLENPVQYGRNTAIGGFLGASASLGAEGFNGLGGELSAQAPELSVMAKNRAMGINPAELTQSPLGHSGGFGPEAGQQMLRANAGYYDNAMQGLPTANNLRGMVQTLDDRATYLNSMALLEDMPNAQDMLSEASRMEGLGGRINSRMQPTGYGSNDITQRVPTNARGLVGTIAGRSYNFGIRAVNAGFAKVMDAVSRTVRTNPQALGEFAGPLQQAVSKGTLAATLFVLHSGNARFRSLMDSYNEEAERGNQVGPSLGPGLQIGNQQQTSTPVVNTDFAVPR